MIRIAIVDDHEGFCLDFQNMLEEYARQEKKDIEINSFHSGEEFCKYWKETHTFELVFLDIELPLMNGIDIGGFLRNHELDETVQIVFVSAKDSYAMQLFRYHPFDFLVKPVSRKDLEYCLNHFFRLLPNNKQYFHYRINRKQLVIEISRIIYFESSRKHIIMHTIGSELSFTGKLDDVEHEIASERFLRIHQSYLVNLNYVTDLRYDTLTLSTGAVLQISRAYQDEVRNRFMHGQIQRMKRGIQNVGDN